MKIEMNFPEEDHSGAFHDRKPRTLYERLSMTGNPPHMNPLKKSLGQSRKDDLCVVRGGCGTPTAGAEHRWRVRNIDGGGGALGSFHYRRRMQRH